jgi:hypothetical protein
LSLGAIGTDAYRDAIQMLRLLDLPLTNVVVDGRYSPLFKLEHVSGPRGSAVPP